MIHKWMEDGYDTIVYLAVLFGSLAFFLVYWKGEYQTRYAEIVMRDFLTDVTTDGAVTLHEYEELIQNLYRINKNYELDIRCREYGQQPVYALIPKEELRSYFMGRNQIKEKPLPEFKAELQEEKAENLKLQTETNATILAAAQKDFIPLPREEDIPWTIEAVRPQQEVYEGESLVTLCFIQSAEGNYYAEAEPITAEASGTIWLRGYTEGREWAVPVNVVCHPRYVICSRGHRAVNSVSVLTESKKKGETSCPYCAYLPEQTACNVTMLQKKTGTALDGDDVWITVTYMDGHVEKVTPDSKEWQDSYDENYCGMQSVVISYRGAEDTVIVISENENCKQCTGECNERCYSDYLEFPYCVECMSKKALFSGKVYEEENWTSTEELTACLDTVGKKKLHRGDFVTLYLSEGKKYVTLMQQKVMQDGK